jgi:hypothetical protein
MLVFLERRRQCLDLFGVFNSANNILQVAEKVDS